MQMLQSSPEHGWADKPGGVFLRRVRSDAARGSDAAARPRREPSWTRRRAASISSSFARSRRSRRCRRGSRPAASRPATIARVRPRPRAARSRSTASADSSAAAAANTPSRSIPPPARSPPAPWVNVVAHPTFGFAATDLGLGFTWSENSHDNRLTPWRNDPVSDPPGEAIFLRDDENGRVWSATPLPAGGGRPYTVRHSQGYSIFEHARDGIASAAAAVRAARRAPEGLRARAAQHLAARAPPLGDALRRMDAGRAPRADAAARRHQPRAGDRCRARHQRLPRAVRRSRGVPRPARRSGAAARMVPPARTITGDRSEFIGRNGTLQRAGRTGDGSACPTVSAPGLDPCGAVQLAITLEPGEERTLIGQLGEAADAAAARASVQRFREADAVRGRRRRRHRVLGRRARRRSRSGRRSRRSTR